MSPGSADVPKPAPPTVPDVAQPGSCGPGLAAEACCEIDGQPWMRYQGMIAPAVAPDRIRPPNLASVKKAVAAQRALGAMWTYDWDCARTPYYYVLCDDPEYDISRFPSASTRTHTRAGLRRTEVRRVSAAQVADLGYAVYAANFALYPDDTPMTAEAFRAMVMGGAAHTEWWGGFCGSALAAINNVFFDGDAAFEGFSKFDPSLRNSYPANAVRYEAARHYLRDRGFRYYSGGARALTHQTSVAEMRLRMGWRLVYARLGLYLAPLARLAVRLGPMLSYGPLARSKFLASSRQKLDTARLLVRIADACASNTFPPDLDDGVTPHKQSERPAADADPSPIAPA